MCVRMAEWWHKNNTHGQVRNASSVPLDCQKVRQYSGFGMSGKTCPASYVSGALAGIQLESHSRLLYTVSLMRDIVGRSKEMHKKSGDEEMDHFVCWN